MQINKTDDSTGKAAWGRFPGLTGTALKVIAIVTMLIDHIGGVVVEYGIMRRGNGLLPGTGMTWLEADRILRMIGRISFPIFLFLLVEGFVYTRHRKEYGIRLFIFALLSEIPFDLAFYDQLIYVDYQNVMFTLLIAFLTLCAMERFGQNVILLAISALAGCGAAHYLKTDYGAYGVGSVIMLYVLRGTKLQLAAGAVVAAIQSKLRYGAAGLAYVPLFFYNGKRGKFSLKYVFYFFYPVHLLLLYLLRRIWLG